MRIKSLNSTLGDGVTNFLAVLGGCLTADPLHHLILTTLPSLTTVKTPLTTEMVATKMARRVKMTTMTTTMAKAHQALVLALTAKESTIMDVDAMDTAAVAATITVAEDEAALAHTAADLAIMVLVDTMVPLIMGLVAGLADIIMAHHHLPRVLTEALAATTPRGVITVHTTMADLDDKDIEAVVAISVDHAEASVG